MSDGRWGRLLALFALCLQFTVTGALRDVLAAQPYVSICAPAGTPTPEALDAIAALIDSPTHERDSGACHACCIPLIAPIATPATAAIAIVSGTPTRIAKRSGAVSLRAAGPPLGLRAPPAF